MDKDNIKLDDSILEDIDVDIDSKEIKKNNNKLNSRIFDEEISIDDLFEFKPMGSVGDEQDFLNNSFDLNKKNTKDESSKFKTKKQKLEEILNTKEDNYSVLKNLNQDHNINQMNNDKYNLNNQFDVKETEIVFDANNLIDNENNLNDEQKNKSLIESALYICGNEGLSINDLKRLTNLDSSNIKKIMKNWINELEKDSNRGITIKIFGERYKLVSKSSNRENLSKLITVKYRNPLSSKVMETLAIIAYNQPCTRAIIENIRAKDPMASIQKLIDLGLIVENGHANTPGRPILYTVTHKFYDIFGIKNLSELPKININQPFQDDDISFFDTTRYND